MRTEAFTEPADTANYLLDIARTARQHVKYLPDGSFVTIHAGDFEVSMIGTPDGIPASVMRIDQRGVFDGWWTLNIDPDVEAPCLWHEIQPDDNDIDDF